ncbi:MAG: hypothetical protein U1F37_08815 [Alphaproteobacteria bacterium]
MGRPGGRDLGLLFDGRVAENFKLLTGTWVAAGMLRLDVLGRGLIQDAAVTGMDQEWVGLLAFPNIAACKAAVGPEGGADRAHRDAVVRHPKLHAALKAKLAAYNAAHPGSELPAASASRVCC